MIKDAMLAIMVRQNVKSSRVTPKGTRSDISVGSSVEPEIGPSSVLVPISMFACFGVGSGIILANYLAEVEVLSMPSNWYLVAGLGFILAGIITSTRLR